jgi:hypothetical protein
MKSARSRPPRLRLPLRFPAPAPTGRWGLATTEWLLAALAIVVVPAPASVVLRACALAIVTLVAALSLLSRRRRSEITVSGWIIVDEEGVAREHDGALTRFTSPDATFGVVLLSNEARDLGVVAITTESATRYIPVRAATDDDRVHAHALFVRPPALTEVDVRHVTRDDAGALSAADASLLVSAIRARDPSALERIVLSDPRGALVVLEGNELRAGDRVIDLTTPLEWRAFLFVESAGAVASVVQATWVRQAGVEVVLVADAAREANHPRGARVSHPDAPPPIESRIAIERLFMAPLRHALECAPRASRVPPPMTSPSHTAPPRAPT